MSDSPGLELRRTARLVLRRPQPVDGAWVTRLHCDPLNYTHDPDGAHTPQRARTMAENGRRDWEQHGISYWIVEHRGHPIGMAGITRATFFGRSCWNLYYRFVPAGRGRGFAAEATREALVVAEQIEPERPVVVRTRPTNEPALRLAETIGLTRRADLDAEGFAVYVSGAWRD